MTQKDPRLWVIIGATGTGKTALSLDLAKRINEIQSEAREKKVTHIINADAMQLYRGMNIGTAKISPDEYQGIPHHFFDALEVTEEATVAWYQPKARKLIEKLLLQGSDVILIGGSGLYVSSVIYDFEFPPRDEKLRQKLQAEYDTAGIDPLLRKLQEIASETRAEIDEHNPRRVIRALEVAMLGADAKTTLPNSPKLWYQNTHILGVQVPREKLVERLTVRVEKMWRDGLVGEVQGLLEKGFRHSPTASRAIGYAQALAQLDGEITEHDAIEQTQILTRRYARRQVSWFKRYADVQWLENPDASEVAL